MHLGLIHRIKGSSDITSCYTRKTNSSVSIIENKAISTAKTSTIIVLDFGINAPQRGGGLPRYLLVYRLAVTLCAKHLLSALRGIAAINKFATCTARSFPQ